jgi:hypothetical protein
LFKGGVEDIALGVGEHEVAFLDAGWQNLCEVIHHGFRSMPLDWTLGVAHAQNFGNSRQLVKHFSGRRDDFYIYPTTLFTGAVGPKSGVAGVRSFRNCRSSGVAQGGVTRNPGNPYLIQAAYRIGSLRPFPPELLQLLPLSGRYRCREKCPGKCGGQAAGQPPELHADRDGLDHRYEIVKEVRGESGPTLIQNDLTASDIDSPCYLDYCPLPLTLTRPDHG